MASITTSVVLLRWPLVSAVLMFLASSLNIQLRKSDYAGLAVICSCMGLAAACWFATGLLGITLLDKPVTPARHHFLFHPHPAPVFRGDMRSL